MQFHPAAQSAPVEDTSDRQNLATVRKRFIRANSDRLHRTRMALNHQQDIFLCALPLLFHCNHPMLPGFVSHNAPAGISGFKPGKADLNYAKTIARSFCLSGGYHGEDIWSIFLMGSVGTLAQSSHSDFDIWLCHRPGLAQAARQELEQKCLRISKWAKTLRLDVHFFLMDCDAFRSGTQLALDTECSGSAQRLLLLDEFYRTALLLAGRQPLWWFVPATDEMDYDQQARELLDRRFIRPDTVLDFGPVMPIPDGEFVGAGIWQLYKAIGSPYKSALKLLLLEAYVHDYPRIAPLALEHKGQIHAADCNINELDPYVMVYRRIERYLTAQGDLSRLELARRCLYFKVNKPLSRPPLQRAKSWQRELLESLVAEWGWTPDYLRLLDQRSEWKTLQVKEARNQLVSALNHSYGMLLDFAHRSRAARSISTAELNELGRKLQASFERRPGKLEWINPGISKDLSEPALALVESRAIENDSRNETGVWQLYAWQEHERVLLRQTHSPVELLFWCHINGIIDGHARLDVSEAPSTSEAQLRRTLARLRQWQPLPMTAPAKDAFKRPAAPTHVMLLLNIAAETPSPFGTDVHRLSNNSDALRYGGMEENLVASVDILTRNSWQELTCQRFAGNSALLQALQTYLTLCLPGTHQAPPQLEIDCLGSAHAALIAQRVRQWFHEITACYYGGTRPASTRFLFTLAGRFYSLQFQGPKLVMLTHKDIPQLLHYLGEAQRRYSPIVVDSYALHNHPLKLISRRISSRAAHVFFRRQQNQLEFYVVDERGSLVQFQCDYTPKLNTLHSLHIFLRNALQHVGNEQSREMGSDFGIHPIEFHELRSDEQQHLSLAPRVITPPADRKQSLDLTARVTCNEQGQFEYDFYCGRQTFAWAQLRQDVFHAAAQYVLSRREHGERYPVFITNLNLEACREQLSSTKELQLSHYLRIKVDLERRLSSALKALP
ncbi:MAG: class I adenylate cyclase [Cellvibrionaceae bacterium]|nr:class I adenylate cyclase [Cellvibrionaceae bacterium]